MEHDQLQLQFKQASALKLLRSDSAPLVITFLYQQFKHRHRLVIHHQELSEKLDQYLEDLQETNPNLYKGTAQTYLRQWCDEEHRYLRRYYDSDGQEIYELTPDTERVLRWMEELNKSEFVGTESRFLRIFDLLQEVVEKSTEDVGLRLKQLEAEKKRVEDEMAQIQASGRVEQYTTTQIKERFFEANDTARRLLADFREVEENFRLLARAVQEQQLKEGARKGHIVGYVLEADTALKESDQGRSFYTFWQFLMSADKQEQLRQLLEQLYQLPAVPNRPEDQRLLRSLKRSLLDAGAKIVESNRKLGEQLRKLLDEQRLSEARRVLQLVAEIKQLGLQAQAQETAGEFAIELETLPEVNLLMERQLWTPSETARFTQQVVETAAADWSTANTEGLFNQFYVDQTALRRKIEALLETKPAVTLAELTQIYPIEQGLAELLTYFTIATQSETHHINEEIFELVQLPEQDVVREIELPQIIFQR
jgi:hypothetical protein